MENQKWDHPSFKCFVFGTSGNGKTTLFRQLVEEQKAHLKIHYDHQGEVSRRFGVPRISTLEQLYNACSIGGEYAFDPAPMYAGRLKVGFALTCRFFYNAAPHIKGRKILITDEAQKVLDDRKDPVDYLTLCDVGRRLQVDLMAIAQSPNQMHPEVRNQITQAYTFRQKDVNAVSWFQEQGFDVEKILNLRPGEWVWQNLDTGETREGGKAFQIKSTGARGRRVNSPGRAIQANQ